MIKCFKTSDRCLKHDSSHLLDQHNVSYMVEHMAQVNIYTVKFLVLLQELQGLSMVLEDVGGCTVLLLKATQS